MLKRIGINAEAAAAAQEAVRVRRRLVGAEPAIFELDLTSSLALSASILYALDRDEEAAAHWSEAADILRRHADNPAHDEDLADVLHLLALAHSAVHRHRDAIGAMNESIEHRRLLNSEPAADQEAALAKALRQRSFDLSAIRRHDEAQTDIAEAVQIFRRLARTAPDRFQEEVDRCESQAVRQRVKNPGDVSG